MQTTEPLPDQAMTGHREAADSAFKANKVDDKQQKQTANPLEKKRSSEPRAAPDVVMLDAVVSDSEQEEEEVGSDADFVAMPKASKKVRLSTSQLGFVITCCLKTWYLLHSFCLFEFVGLIVSPMALIV